MNGIEATRLNIKMPHEHAHRTMQDIRVMVEDSDLPKQVIADTIGIFSIIAEAEGSSTANLPTRYIFTKSEHSILSLI